jgi:hypothetical protein
MPDFSLDESLVYMQMSFTFARLKEWLLFIYDMGIHWHDSPPFWNPTFVTWGGKKLLLGCFRCRSTII